MDLGAVVTGFLGGSVVAWTLNQVVTHGIMRPVISVNLDEKRGCYGPTELLVTDKDGEQTSHSVRFLRLLVENTGLSSIKDCCGYITKLTKRTGKEEEEIVPKQEIIDLGWAHHAHSSARSIPRGAFFHMEVVTLYLFPTGRVLRPPRLPTSLMDFFAEKGTYEFMMLIVAKNAPPREIAVKFDFDPQEDDLKVYWRTWADHPWWKRWLNRMRYPWWKPWLDRLRSW